MRIWKQILLGTVLGIGLLGSLGMRVYALDPAQSSSANWQVDQVFFGSAGALDNCSANYCAKESAGEIAVGNTSSGDYQAQAGFNTDRSPSLTLIVTTANIDFGILNPGTTYTATASFSVKSYLSNGYQVVTDSPPPSDGTHTIAAPSTPSFSNSATEQFGINLVNNTTACSAPANFGANPVQIPSSAFSYGAVSSAYDTCGKFQYVDGSQLAYSAISSGETDYTISYILNITNVTPAGYYSMNHTLIATSYF